MKVCKLCGKEITDTDRRSYCSKECAVEANRIRSREKYHTDVDKLSTPAKCMNCGKEFIRKQEKQKYCCYSCKQEMVYAEKRLRGDYTCIEYMWVILLRKAFRILGRWYIPQNTNR